MKIGDRYKFITQPHAIFVIKSFIEKFSFEFVVIETEDGKEQYEFVVGNFLKYFERIPKCKISWAKK